jgi:hypothetical protein
MHLAESDLEKTIQIRKMNTLLDRIFQNRVRILRECVLISIRLPETVLSQLFEPMCDRGIHRADKGAEIESR